ncbi:MAG TPA: O-antigen ligase family protein [Candidatus Deferrimicrobium sp.]|nr:O-antigen ligase family protein [Candidatus Deferrimicrobium sp.]
MLPDDKYDEDQIKKQANLVDITILFITLALLVFPAWARGGTLRQFLTPYPWIAVISFFIFLLTPYWRRNSHVYGRALVGEQIRAIVKDPVFYLGLAFLSQLYIQWWNSGKVHILGKDLRSVTFSSPYIDWLPGAVEANRSLDMIKWFFPVFIALMILRHGFTGSRMVKILTWGMIINAAILAIFGFIAPGLTKNYPMWLNPILPQQPDFSFSTFGYPNHAASFFILHLGLACGLFFRYYKNRKQENRLLPVLTALLGIILLLFFAIQMTRCRYAMLFTWLMAASFISYFLYLSVWKTPGRKLKIGLISTGIVFLLIMSASGFYFIEKNAILPELSSMSQPGKFIKEQYDLKHWQVEAAFKMWKDYPIFGVGGGGYGEHLLPYVKNPANRKIAIEWRGMSNVHNDFVQFLCEFGIIGTGLLLTVLILLIIKIKVSGEWKTASFVFGLIGILGVSIHSLIDLPFRSPPVIIAFAVVLAGFGKLKQTSPAQVNEFEKASKGKPVKGIIHFYTILFLFIGIILWGISKPMREKISNDIFHDVETQYNTQLITLKKDTITPGLSPNASPSMLRTLWWAKILYDDYKDIHLLSSQINFDLYRKSPVRNENKAQSYLKEAFRNSMMALRFTTYADAGFIKQHAAILDALGYYLEESWCLKFLGDSCPQNSEITLLIKEYYEARPYLIH